MTPSDERRAPAVIVALEGAGRPASLAGQRAGGARVVRTLSDEREHASDLAAELASLLDELGVAPRAVELVVVGLGPGSYTGLRVTAATALGLALGSGAALIGVPSFAALALGALAPGEVADIAVDARGGHIYHARYRRTADSVAELSAPAALEPAVAREALLFGAGADGARSAIWLADADALAAAGITEVPATVRVVGGCRARAEDVLQLGLARAAARGWVGEATLEPLYLRNFVPKVRAR